ncbi:MAG TPA: PP2C family protein-serine/threonine phosphatase, partial [Bacteroidia bacterium]|nr:PP2C family protein-serine/threonine phosphatase [Bacteroidia bacterium]
EKNKSLTDSLNYAKLIQNAITHKDDKLSEVLPQSFILEMPLDIVSGDFVRVDEKDEKILLALADCTGHGIPGALVSMIGCTLLNGIVNCKNKTNPAVILKTLNVKFKRLISQATINDGMDIGFCSIDRQNMELNFAGAHRPLYLIREGVLTEIKGDNMAIGNHSPDEAEFTCHTFQLQKGDSLYMFSDGYTDQFGGEKGKKFSTKRFKETLLSIQHLDMDIQQDYLRETLNQWKQNLAQVDDICVLGFRI